MLKILAQSDCIICSSLNETFGVGLIEACNFGLPVISSNCEGPSDIVNNLNGIIISKNDTKNFCYAIMKLLKESRNLIELKLLRT